MAVVLTVTLPVNPPVYVNTSKLVEVSKPTAMGHHQPARLEVMKILSHLFLLHASLWYFKTRQFIHYGLAAKLG